MRDPLNKQVDDRPPHKKKRYLIPAGVFIVSSAVSAIPEEPPAAPPEVLSFVNEEQDLLPAATTLGGLTETTV